MQGNISPPDPPVKVSDLPKKESREHEGNGKKLKLGRNANRFSAIA